MRHASDAAWFVLAAAACALVLSGVSFVLAAWLDFPRRPRPRP